MAFEIANESIESNSSKWIEIPVTEDADMSPVSIRAYVINGSGEGPTVWIQGGIHGNEQVGGLAFRDFALELSPEDVNGTLITVPASNPSAFANKRRGSQIRQVGHNDTNRLFPGNPDGTFTEQLAHALYTTVTANVDYFVDTHSAGDEQVMDPGFSIYYESSDDDVNIEMQEMVEAVGLPAATALDASATKGSMAVELTKEGIPSVLIETGGSGVVHDWAYENFSKGVTNVCKQVGLLDGGPDSDTEVTYYDALTFLLAHKGGYFESHVSGGETVSEGETLGVITNIEGEIVETITAPYDAVMIAERTYPMVRPGDLVFETVPQEGAEGYSNIS